MFKQNISWWLLLCLVTSMPGCKITLNDDEEPVDEISNQIAQGSIGDGIDFLTESTLVEERALFGDDGYYFHLFGIEQECSNNLLGEVRFFIESPQGLAPGNYRASGPFFGNTSFFGAEVVIKSVSATHIEGKVKGGDFNGDKHIEGAFSALICQ